MTIAIEPRARLWSDRVTVIDHASGEELTYAELADRIAIAASRLTALEVGPDDVVGLLTRNRVEVLSLLFAIRRLGAVLAPLSHQLSKDGIERLVERMEPTVVLHESAQRDLSRVIPQTVETLTFEQFERVEPKEEAVVTRDPESALLYFHTEIDGDSPIVEVSARQTEWNCITEAVGWELSADDLAPIVVSMSRIDGLHRLTLPLLYVGGTVVIQRAYDPPDTLEIIEERGATCLFGHATEVRELTGASEFEEANMSRLRWIACGDEVPTTVRGDLEVRGTPVLRTYGTTESGPNSLFVPPTETDVPPERLGRPFPDCEVLVADENGDAVEPGTPGRLLVRGPVTASGYLDTDDGTFADGWVRTGELVRETVDGAIDILPRGNE